MQDKRWPRLLHLEVGLTLLLGVVSAISLTQDIGRPFLGFLHIHAISANVWLIHTETPSYWPAFRQLPWSGAIVAIKRQPPDNAVADVFRRAAQPPNPIVALQIESDGQRMTVNLPVKPFTWADWLDLKLPRWISSLVYWLLALAILRNSRPGDPTAQACIRASLISAATLVTGARGLFHMDLSGEFRQLDHGIDLLATWLYGYAAAHYFALGAYYPSPMQGARWITRAAQIMCAIAATVFAAGHVVIYANWGWVPLAGWLDSVGHDAVVWLLIASNAFWFGRLIFEAIARQHNSLTRRKATRVPIFLGLVAWFASAPSVVPTLAHFMPQPAYAVLATVATALHGFGFDLRYITIFLPLAFSYVILSNQTTKSHSKLFILAIILAINALFASLFDALFRILYRSISDFAQLAISPFLIAFAACTAVGLFWYWVYTSPRMLWRVFQWQKINTDAHVSLGQQLTWNNTFKNVSETHLAILRILAHAFHLERCAIWLVSSGHASPKRIYAFGNGLDVSSDQFVQAHHRLRFIEDGRAVLLPLRMDDQLIGYFGVGNRIDEEVFHELDAPILSVAAQQIALLLTVLENVEQIRAMPRHIAQAQEHEHERIGRELHDSTQQFLGRLPIYLGILEEASTNNRPKFEALLRRIEVEIAREAETLRAIRRNLFPIDLESSLRRPLSTLVERGKHF